jgi:hypothetical protein
MIPILCALVMMLFAGGVVFCAVIGGYQSPDEWWGEGVDPETVPRLTDP